MDRQVLWCDPIVLRLWPPSAVCRRTLPLPERTVFLPSFETDPKPGGRKNDRFAYGSFTAMRVRPFARPTAGREGGSVVYCCSVYSFTRSQGYLLGRAVIYTSPPLPADLKVIMNRIATLIEPNAGMYSDMMDSEWVLGHHMEMNNITVRNTTRGSRATAINSNVLYYY